MNSDQEIVAKIMQGDMRSFKTVIQNNERLVAHIVGKLTFDKEEAKDICQEVFIKVYKNLKYFQFKSKLSTWIASIAYKESLNHLKKKKLNYLLDDSENFQFKAPEDLPDRALNKKQITEFINLHIQSLPEQYKIVLVLYHMEDMSYEEIVQVTEMPEGTVKNYLFRARKLLKEKLVSINKKSFYESL